MRRRRDGGYITVMVLTFAGLMAALVAATLHVARPGLGQAVLNIDDMQADGLIEAGVAVAGYALYAGRRPASAVSGATVPFETGAVKLTVAPEGGRVDLNGADRALLEGLYSALGSGAMPPGMFAGRIIDWRDRNSKTEPQGAESEEYAGFGLNYGPRNGAFLSIEELMLVPGIGQEDFERLKPFLTVYNPEGRIDPAGADLAVLRAVPRMTDPEAVQIRTAFADPEVDKKQLNRLIQPFRKYLSRQNSMVYRVRVDVRLNNGFLKSVETVLMQGGQQSPYDVLDWRPVGPAEATT